MKIDMDKYKSNTTNIDGLLQYTPKDKIKSDQIELDFILTFKDIPQFWFSKYYPEDISEPEVLEDLFSTMEVKEKKQLIKVSICQYDHDNSSEKIKDWVSYDDGKRFFNQDINKYIEKDDKKEK